MRTGDDDGTTADRGTFTQTARRAQLVGCAIDALAEVGYQQTTVAEVARRAGVSKGVVTYYFPARDDLVWAVVAAVFASVGEHVGNRLEDVAPGQFVAVYLRAWVDYYRTYRREMMAIAEIWTSFRDASGHPHLDARTLGRERALVEAALAAGQAEGALGDFSPRVMAVTLKAALDGLLAQLAMEPALDLDAYLRELVALFDRATRAALSSAHGANHRDPAMTTHQAGGKPMYVAKGAYRWEGRASVPDVPQTQGRCRGTKDSDRGRRGRRPRPRDRQGPCRRRARGGGDRPQ
jgi:AcrR family transcriptional regulator